MSTLDHDAKFGDDRRQRITAAVSGACQSPGIPDATQRPRAMPVRGQRLFRSIACTIMPRFTPVRHFGGPSAAKAAAPIALSGETYPTRSCFPQC
jgi:hypothetical protein